MVNYNLTPEDEEIVNAVLARITEKVQKRRLQVFPFFKDFDRVSLSAESYKVNKKFNKFSS